MGITFSSSSLWCLLRPARQLLQRAPSTTTPAFLPDELIFDILSKVPVKSLCRFRCVSKGWRAIISDPFFIAAQKSHPAELLLVVGYPKESCLRLVDVDGSVARVINYTTCGWTPVCSSPIDDVLSVTGYANGAPVAGMIDLTTMKVLFAHLERDRAWGCGRAVPSGAYKVVRFKSSHECEVSTVGDGDGWRKRKSFPFRTDFCSRDNYTAAVDGVLHFLAVAVPDAAGSVLRFDLEKEEWRSRIKGPQNVKLGRLEIKLGELNGALCMVEPGIHYTDNGYTNVWLLTDYDKSLWVKAYKIPLDPSTYYQMMPLRVYDGGCKLLFCYEKVGEESVLQIYNHYYDTCTDAMNKLLGGHISGIGFCSLHLEGLSQPKSSAPNVLSEVFPYALDL